MLTGREKIYFVVISIFNKSQTTPKGKPITLNRALDLNNRIPMTELKDIMQILERDEQVIVFERKLEKAAENIFNERIGTYVFDLTTRFESYFRMMLKEEGYQDYAGTRQTTNSNIDMADIVFYISYTQTSGVILNNYLQIAKPDFMSENDQVMEYLYNNPNRTIKKEEIETTQAIEIKKELKKVINQLGFKGGLEKVFFSVSKEGIIFRNPITRQQIEKMKIGLITFRPN